MILKKRLSLICIAHAFLCEDFQAALTRLQSIAWALVSFLFKYSSALCKPK